MAIRALLITLVAVLPGCALFSHATPAEDMSIRFPDFHGRSATSLSEEGQPYVMDGAVLQAISIAANDFSPRDDEARACWQKVESQRYQVIRQAGTLFVQIALNPASCGHGALDGGVKYAIRLSDGHILRRLFDGEPENLESAPDASPGQSVMGTPVPASEVGTTSAPSHPAALPRGAK